MLAEPRHTDYHKLPIELRPPRIIERPQGSGVFVRLDDSYLRSIVYIGTKRPGSETEIDAHGTGFLVAHEGHSYLVTAAHVAVDFEDGSVDIRINRNDNGGGQIVPMETVRWHYHSDRAVDVAVIPFSPPAWARVIHLPTKSFATDFKVNTKNFGAGDLAYVVGIFNKVRGANKNVPFVHTGHIASMGHDEKVVTENWWPDDQRDYFEIEGYLVQVTTLPESSGSPVFVRRSIVDRIIDPAFVPPADAKKGDKIKAPTLKVWYHGTVWLLGLWHGRWAGADTGLCVPVPRILEVLDKDELKRMRQDADQGVMAKNALTLQSKSKEMSGDDILRAALNAAPVEKPKPKAKRSARDRT